MRALAKTATQEDDANFGRLQLPSGAQLGFCIALGQKRGPCPAAVLSTAIPEPALPYPDTNSI
jgi:hypothetical protein